MIQSLYSDKTFIKTIKDSKTTNVAYKFDETTKSVSVISTKSNDSFIAKIIYHAKKFFGGYQSVDLLMQKELISKNVSLIFDVSEFEQSKLKIEELKKINQQLVTERNKLIEQKQKLQEGIDISDKDLKNKNSEIEQKTKLINDYNQKINKISSLEIEIRSLEHQILNLKNKHNVLNKFVGQNQKSETPPKQNANEELKTKKLIKKIHTLKRKLTTFKNNYLYEIPKLQSINSGAYFEEEIGKIINYCNSKK